MVQCLVSGSLRAGNIQSFGNEMSTRRAECWKPGFQVAALRVLWTWSQSSDDLDGPTGWASGSGVGLDAAVCQCLKNGLASAQKGDSDGLAWSGCIFQTVPRERTTSYIKAS